MKAVIEVKGLKKTFTLHTQNGTKIPVFAGLELKVFPGECLALVGESGSGKSTLMRALYANYKPQAGSIRVRHGEGWVDMVSAPPNQILRVRRRTMGYVSQFLRVIPRVPAAEVVAEPLKAWGVEDKAAEDAARAILDRVRIPQNLWSLAPSTFSGGEQQRVNLARGFIAGYPIMLLDEPTASLDASNRAVVLELIQEAKERGAALVGIFHDEKFRSQAADRVFPMPAGGKGSP
jgi:alpha-D-ribose 1-methylphosphonate 5-triphosphate synthase subunit PhnL